MRVYFEPMPRAHLAICISIILLESGNNFFVGSPWIANVAVVVVQDIKWPLVELAGVEVLEVGGCDHILFHFQVLLGTIGQSKRKIFPSLKTEPRPKKARPKVH